MKVMCDKCYNIIDLGDIGIDMSPEVIPNTDNALLVKGIVCNCECCPNESANIIIDDNIAEFISILNKKGYRTVQACEGHKDKDVIYFITSVYYDDLYYNFHDFCNKNNYDCGGVSFSRQSVNKNIFSMIMYYIKYSSADEKYEIIEKLTEWAKNLPEDKIEVENHILQFKEWLNDNPDYKELNDEIFHMYEDTKSSTSK